jgi:flagellar motor switch protein FliM
MTSEASPQDMRTRIVEGLTGATGDPARIADAARACGQRCLAAIAPQLVEMLAPAISVECVSVELARFASARPAASTFSAMTIVAADNSPDALLMTADADALAIALCAMFGADEDLPVTPITRPLSPIELDIAAQLFDIFANAFNGSGDRSMRLRFPLPAPITGEEVDKQVMRDGPAASIFFEIALGEARGRVSVTMPQRVLLEHRGEARAESGSGAQWRERFGEEVMRSAVSLTATIPLARLTLAQISHLRVGQVLELETDAPSQTKLSSRDRTLFMCEFGKLGENYTVRVVEPFDAKRELVEELLTA